MEAEAILSSTVKNKHLWVDLITVPDGTVWPELRGGIAAFVEPPAWFAINIGFLAVVHMRGYDAEYRRLGYDHTSEVTPRIQESFEPILRDIRAAREALHPVAYPDYIRLPEGDR